MSAHAERLTLFHRPIQRFLLPLAGWALVTALIAITRRRARQPSMPLVSEEWLHTYEREAGRLFNL